MNSIGNDRYSERSAAHYLGVSPITLRSYRKQGKLQPESTHGIVIYTKQTLDDFRALFMPVIEFNRRRVGWGTSRDEKGKRLLPKDFGEQLIKPHLNKTIFSNGGNR